MGLLVHRHRRTGPQATSPRRLSDRGLGYELLQALVGAVLPHDYDYDYDYDASLPHSLTFHVTDVTTGDFNATARSQMQLRYSSTEPLKGRCQTLPEAAGGTR